MPWRVWTLLIAVVTFYKYLQVIIQSKLLLIKVWIMKIYFYLLNNENLLLFIFLVINNNIISPNSAFCFAGWCFVLSTDTMTSLTTGRIINLKYYTLYTTIPLNTVQGSFSYKEGWLQQFFKMLLLWQDPLYEAKVMKCKTWSSDLIWLISWFQVYQWFDLTMIE